MAAGSLQAKEAVSGFWDAAACGELGYALGQSEIARLNAQAEARYRLEPYLKPFARFAEAEGRDVLEIGVGMGADHLELARANPKSLTGIDLTPRAIDFTRARFEHVGFTSDLRVADAENLPFRDETFDLVYSWGVLHHSPNTSDTFHEMHRVLRRSGIARIMIYHKWSVTGLMLWARYAALKGRIFHPITDIYSLHLESPGTKAYTRAQAEELLRNAGFASWNIQIQLNHGDLLEGAVGQRHQGFLFSTAKKLWPRSIIRRFGRQLGLYLLIEAWKE